VFEKMPFISGARRYADEWIFPGGSSDNRSYFSSHVKFATGIDEPSQMLLFDAQTSGGLLLCVPKNQVGVLMERASQIGQPLWVVGDIIEGKGVEVI
jgi:selenide,water dikinase